MTVGKIQSPLVIVFGRPRVQVVGGSDGFVLVKYHQDFQCTCHLGINYQDLSPVSVAVVPCSRPEYSRWPTGGAWKLTVTQSCKRHQKQTHVTLTLTQRDYETYLECTCHLNSLLCTPFQPLEYEDIYVYIHVVLSLFKVACGIHINIGCPHMSFACLLAVWVLVRFGALVDSLAGNIHSVSLFILGLCIL